MATPVEFLIRYDDGTQWRATGEDSEIAHSCLYDDADADQLKGRGVTSKPLRKVTEVEGHLEDWPGDEAYISGSGKTMLAEVFPAECRNGCPRYRFRITVEAIRVEEKKP